MEGPETIIVCDFGSGACCSPVSSWVQCASNVQAKSPLVVTGSLKAGFPGHMYPRAIVRSVVEKSTTPHLSDTQKGPQKWVYKPVVEANYQKGCIESDGYVNPCVNGIVSDWDAMQVLLEHTFNKLKVRVLPIGWHSPSDTTVSFSADVP